MIGDRVSGVFFKKKMHANVPTNIMHEQHTTANIASCMHKYMTENILQYMTVNASLGVCRCKR